MIVHCYLQPISSSLQTCMCVSALLRMLLFLVGGAFGGNRGVSPVPPEKGVFPLDHMHLCDRVRVYSVNEQMYILKFVFLVTVKFLSPVFLFFVTA